MRDNFGISIHTLWENFNLYLEDKFGKQIETINNAGITQAKISSGFSLLGQQPKYDKQGNLYYIMSDGYSSPVIRRVSANSQESSDLVDLVRPGYFDVLDNGNLVYSQLNLCNSAISTAYYDLYIRDQGSGDERKLGNCQRYKFVRWHPDGKSLFVTRYSNGKSELLILDTKGNIVKSLLQTEGNDTIGSFAVSPNGRKITASLFRQEHGWELYQLNTESSLQLTRLTNNKAIELDPSYSYDGQFVVYTSNYGNIYNVWQLSTKSLEQHSSPKAITNVMSAAFGANVHPDNTTITYSQFDSLGYRLHSAQIEARPATVLKRKITVSHETPAILTSSEPVQPVTEEAVDYSAFNSYSAPSWWWPLFSFDYEERKLGFFTAGNDQLQRHIYSLQLIHHTAPKHPVLEGFEGIAEYAYNNQIALSYNSESNIYRAGDSANKPIYQSANDLSFLSLQFTDGYCPHS